MRQLSTPIGDGEAQPKSANRTPDNGLDFGSDLWTPDRFGAALQGWSQTGFAQRRVRTLSLFTGAGGLDIGFHDAGFDIVEMVEIDTRFCATLHRNALPDGYFTDAHISCIDVRRFMADPDSEGNGGEVELIIGGPPCQTFSAAGRRAAGVSGMEEDRGTLFNEYVRLLCAIQPRAFVFENVDGIAGARSGRDWSLIQRAFASAGYDLHVRILDAADFGVPQHRERMFLVGVRSGSFAFPRPTHGPDSEDNLEYFTPSRALSGVDITAAQHELLRVEGRYEDLLPQIPAGLNYSFFTQNMGHPRPIFAWRSKFSDFLYKADPNKPVRTIKAQCGQYTGPFHWNSRRFSIEELKRLQSFPDDYVLTGGRSVALKQIGNSVPPQMSRMLAIAVASHVFNADPPFRLSSLSESDQLGFRQRKRAISKHYQAIARQAIERSRVVAPMIEDHELRLSAGVADNFDFVMRGDCADHSVTLSFSSRKSFQITTTVDRRRSRAAFTISIKPVLGTEWIIPVRSIEMAGTQVEAKQFLVLWKALSWWLRNRALRDDLVQLAGYYAYEPAIRCAMSIRSSEDWRWNALVDIVSGIAVRKVMDWDSFSDLLRIHVRQVPEFVRFLRRLGYEVRSERTNPQFKFGTLLVPYSFPTLTRESVQRHKEPLDPDFV